MNNRTDKNHAPHASIRQLRYAALLQWGTRIAFAVMIVTYLLYVSGIVQPFVPRDKIKIGRAHV